MRQQLIALVTSTILVGCGGGGPDKGVCVFAPSDCGSSTTAPTTTPTNPSFSRTGTGDATFTLPGTVSVVRIQGQFSGTTSNFIVQVGDDLVVNTIVGTSATPQAHDGTYAVAPGATVTITNSNGVSWSLNATTAQSPPTIGVFSKSGVGDQVMDLPSRNARYRVQASFSGASSNFIVIVAGSLAINSIIGTSLTPSNFDGTYTFASDSRVEIQNAPGVTWSFIEVP